MRARAYAPRQLPAWAALAAACLGQFMSVLDGTIVNVALPAIRRSLDLGIVDLQWVVNAYLLTFGGLLLLGGRIGDHFGRKRVYLVGAVVFSIASLIGGIAPTAATLIAARAVQGIGAALVTPGTLSLLTAAYPEARSRTRALGVWSAVQGAAASAGVLLGGVLTDTLGWRWVFFVNVPIGVVVLVLGGAALVESRARDHEAAARLDVGGALLITVAMTLLVYAVVDTDRYAWGSVRTLVPLVASALALLAFLAYEARVASPLIPLAFLRRRAVSASVTTISLFGAVLTAGYYFLSLYLQGPRGLSPLAAGLAFLPATVISVCSSAIGSRLCARFGARAPLAAALCCSTLGMLWLSRFGVHSGFVLDVLVPTGLFGAGVGMTFVGVTVLVTSGVEPQHTGLASGLINAGRQIGGSIGLAALSVVAATHTRDLLASHQPLAAATASGYGRALLVGAALSLVALAVVALRGSAPRASARRAAVRGGEAPALIPAGWSEPISGPPSASGSTGRRPRRTLLAGALIGATTLLAARRIRGRPRVKRSGWTH